jgi:Domain of unknown function (DUF3597)
MSIFSAIKNAIFGHPRAQQQAPAAGAGQQGGAHGVGQAMPQMGQQPAAPQPAAPQQTVDVEAVLTEISRQKGNPDLNWKSSIVDLMKLLDLDSSLDNRKQLATELGYTGATDGSGEMNVWLHRKVMDELERNGGRVPLGLKH